MFSGAVRLVDLNDFIAPSQACVVALKSSGGGGGSWGEKVRGGEAAALHPVQRHAL